ncbi:MAG: radical SAM-associated putative lipoprotein [Bacteroidales bacterium]|nr:radical SAM-associated putative lipoprotein [Bacteroidales bacterium]
MKQIIKKTNAVLAFLLGLFGFYGCEKGSIEYGTPHADYTVKGKIIDKATKKSIKGVRVVFEPARPIYMYGVPVTGYNPKSAVSDDGGNYKLTESSLNALIPNIPDLQQQEVYFLDVDGEENGLYRDTMIVVDFAQAEKTKKQNNWYEGEYTVSKDIELQKKDE